MSAMDGARDLPAGTYAFFPGRVEDAALTAFLHALKGARVKDLGQGMQLVSFGPGSHFPDDTDLRRSDFVVRDFYGDLFKNVESRPASLLVGVPGTGKSWWIWFAVHRLLNQDNAPAIVWQTFKRDAAQCVLFKGGKAFVGPRSAFLDELADPSTWFFVDGMLPVWVDARTVVVCSPNREVYKEWIKGRDDIVLTMPLWTWPEMEVLRRELYKDKVTQERAKRNFELWYGGVPRLVLEVPARTKQDLPEDSAAALAAIEQAEIEEVLKAVKGWYDAVPEASHRVVHQDGDRETFRALSPKFATMHVGVQFALHARANGMLERLMAPLAGPSNVDSSSRDHFFKVLGHCVMRSSGRVEYKFLDVPCDIPAEGKAGGPTNEQQTAMQEALDAAAAEAAGGLHARAQEHPAGALQGARPLPRHGGVPADMYPNFTAAPLRRGSLPRVGKTYVRVVKIEAALPRSTQAKPTTQAKRLLPVARTFARSAHPAVRCWA